MELYKFCLTSACRSVGSTLALAAPQWLLSLGGESELYQRILETVHWYSHSASHRDPMLMTRYSQSAKLVWMTFGLGIAPPLTHWLENTFESSSHLAEDPWQNA